MATKVIPGPPPPPPPDGAPTVTVGTPDLPPPGYSREEELKQRADALEEYAERRAGQLGLEPIDPAKLKPDREILAVMDVAMQITNAVPGWAYCWTPRTVQGSTLPEHEIMRKEIEGWIVVKSSDPECPNLKKGPAGERWFGDTVLMKIPQDIKDRLDAQNEFHARARVDGVDAAIREMGERYRNAGVVVTDKHDIQERAVGASAEQIAGRKVEDLIRKGSMPGMRTRS